MYRSCLVVLFLVFLFQPTMANAQSKFQKYILKNFISVEVPKSWKIIGTEEMEQIDTETEVITGRPQGNNDILLAANCYTKYEIASATFRVSVRNKHPSFSQEDLSELQDEDLELLGVISYKNELKIAKLLKDVRVISAKAYIKKIDGYNALLNETDFYHGSRLINKRLFIIPFHDKLVKVFCTYDKNEKYFFNILNRMIFSVKFLK